MEPFARYRGINTNGTLPYETPLLLWLAGQPVSIYLILFQSVRCSVLVPLDCGEGIKPQPPVGFYLHSWPTE